MFDDGDVFLKREDTPFHPGEALFDAREALVNRREPLVQQLFHPRFRHPSGLCQTRAWRAEPALPSEPLKDPALNGIFCRASPGRGWQFLPSFLCKSALAIEGHVR